MITEIKGALTCGIWNSRANMRLCLMHGEMRMHLQAFMEFLREAQAICLYHSVETLLNDKATLLNNLPGHIATWIPSSRTSGLPTNHLGCAGRPARSKWCKSTMMKGERTTSASIRAQASVRMSAKRRWGNVRAQPLSHDRMLSWVPTLSKKRKATRRGAQTRALR